ncbi:MAG: glycosyltransferase family 4 protein [Gaiellaceae bacterium]
MRILICASDAPLPPTNTGFRRQLMGLVPELGKRHDVRLIGYRMPNQSTTGAAEAGMQIIDFRRPGLAENARDLTLAMIRRRPLRAERLVRGLIGPLREELARFEPDLVHVGPGKLAGLKRELEGLPRVLMVMDTWHLNVDARADAATGIRRPLLRADARRIRRFETSEYRGFDRVVVSNEGDLAELRERDPTLPFAIVPIGFDASAYAPDPGALVDPNRIIFHGAMSYAPNVRAVEFLAGRVLPRVRAVRPAAHLVIVGRDPAPRVLELEEIDGVHVTGGVDDMRSWLTGSRVWAGPFLDGTGIKTKLLEAMATDLPCVVTPLGHRGLDDITSGEQLLVGSTEEELAEHLVAVLEDDELARRLGRTGGEYVRPRYDWPAVGEAYDRLYEAVLAEHGRLAAAR